MEVMFSLQSVKHVHPQLNDPFSKTFLQIFRCAKDLFNKEEEEEQAIFLEPKPKDKIGEEEDEDDKVEQSLDDTEKIERSLNRSLLNSGTKTHHYCPQPFSDAVNKKPLVNISDGRESATHNPNPNPNERLKKRKLVERNHLLAKKKPKTKMGGGSGLNKKKVVVVVPNPPPPLPPNMADQIRALKGTRVEVLLYKRLYKTDLSISHNRLFMPVTQLVDKDFLTEEEKSYLDMRVMDKPCEMRVRVIQPNSQLCDVTFKKWDLKKENGKVSPMFVFNKEWNQIHVSNKLTAGTVLQIWTFRMPPQGHLCFALVRL